MAIRNAILGLALAITVGLATNGYAGRRHSDIHNIGNRKLSGKIFKLFPNIISVEKELALGSQSAAAFEETARMLDDPVIGGYVERVGQNLVKHSDAKIPFYIKVVDSDDVNAFALPGGYFYVNKGLLMAASNEAELAGVMAHEIAHVCARHAIQSLSRAQYLQVAALPLSYFGGSLAQLAIQAALGLGSTLELQTVNRSAEKEADQLGAQYLWNTGYDPNAFVSFFEKMQAMERDKPGRFASWFRSHPSLSGRILSIMNEQRYLPDKDEYLLDTSEFHEVKSRLLASYKISIRPAAADSVPQLKRTDPPAGTDPEQEDERNTQKNKKGRPVLKRVEEPPFDQP